MAQFAVSPNKVMVNKQFNSPINLYSTSTVNETLAKQTTILSNGAIGIDFHQLAAPNLAKSAVLKMLEEEEAGSRGEHATWRKPRKINTEIIWPPTPPMSPPSRSKMVHDRQTTAVPIEWPPKFQNSTATFNTATHLSSNVMTNEQTNSSWLHRSSNQQGLKRVAWPPPPDQQLVVSTTSQHNLLNSQGEQTFVNGGPIEANPPAQLLCSPIPQEQAHQPKWEAAAVEPVYYSSVIGPGVGHQAQAASAPSSTAFTRPAVQTPPPPSTVTLRPKAPISQPPPPVIKSQPALQTQTLRSAKMRGDQKWPPADYKAMKQAEETATLTRGPAVKPRLVKKDYTSFFAQHALTPTYAGYRAPPGTQHYSEESKPNNGNA